ncbi:uncharacterized protein TNCV_2806891 [Trichonephila clavipes]|nr:uncharacterized protein TNCV_2806891 [Trichonephila clavipes]
MNLTSRNPPAHHWYAAKSPGLSIQCRSSRAHQTAMAHLRSGHLRSMTFVQGVKSFFTCSCSLLASLAHLLDCWGISLRQLYEEQDLVCIKSAGFRSGFTSTEYHSLAMQLFNLVNLMEEERAFRCVTYIPHIVYGVKVSHGCLFTLEELHGTTSTPAQHVPFHDTPPDSCIVGVRQDGFMASYTRAFGDGPRNLNHGQVTWTTPKLAPPLRTTTPHQREDVSALDRFNVNRCPTRRVFSGTGLEPVTKQATDCGSPVVKVSDHGRHVMSSSPVPLKIRRVGQRCSLNLLRAETSSRWCGVVVRRGRCQLRCRSLHLTMVQNYVVRRQKPSCS